MKPEDLQQILQTITEYRTEAEILIRHEKYTGATGLLLMGLHDLATQVEEILDGD